MADVVVGASVQVDTGNTNPSLKEVKKNLNEVKQAMGETSTQAKKTGGDVSESTGHFTKLKEGLSALPGPVGQSTQAVGGLSGAFKALLANPVVLVITAIVGVLTLLFKAFTSTRQGAELLEQVWAGLSGAIDKARQILVSFFQSLKSVGDFFSKLGNLMAHPIDTIKSLSKELINAAQATADLAKAQQMLDRDQVNNLARNKELIQQQERLKQIRDDGSKSTAERIKANDEAYKLEKERLATMENLQQRQVDLLKERIRLKGGENNVSTEQLKELREAELELADLREESIGRETELITNRNSLQREANQKAAEARKAAAEKQKEEQQKLAEFNKQLLTLQQANELSLIADGYQKELKALEFKFKQERAMYVQQFNDKRITQEQLNQLNAALLIQENAQQAALKAKFDDEAKKKEEDFQKDIAGIKQRITLLNTQDTYAKEKLQLQIQAEEKLQEAIARYKDDATKLQAAKILIDEELKLQLVQLEEKRKQEEEKKKFDEQMKNGDDTLNDPEASYAQKKAALDAEQQAIQEAYDQHVISDTQFTEAMAANSERRKQLIQAETDHRLNQASMITNALAQVASFAGKQTGFAKAVAIAGATVDTIRSGVAAFRAGVEAFPGPGALIAGAAFAAVAVASGLASIKKMVSVKVPGSTDSGGSVPSGVSAPAAPITPQVQTTKIDASSTEDIGNSLKGGVKTFVVDADTQNARDRQARLERAATLGG